MPPPTTAIYKALMLPPSLWGADRRVVYSGHFFDATAFGRLGLNQVEHQLGHTAGSRFPLEPAAVAVPELRPGDDADDGQGR